MQKNFQYSSQFFIFAALYTSMKSKKSHNNRQIYSLWHKVSCGFMLITLLWLTVSAPLNILVSEKLAKVSLSQSIEENVNPFSGLNEEKHSATSNLSEYLHEHFSLSTQIDGKISHVSPDESLIYLKYYGELVSPPPEV